jgi:hypothetical protein
MWGFRKRGDADLERELRARRPQPQEELVHMLAARVQATQRFRHRAAALRVALGSGVTALFVAALVPAGGLGYATGAVSRATTAVKHTATPAHGHADPSHHHGDHPTSGQHEYGVPICHHNHHGFEAIRVSPEALHAHLAHHGDIVPAPEHGCPH